MNLLKLFAAALLTVSLFSANAQTEGMVRKKAVSVPAQKTETFQVLGNCDMCKKTIEKAAVSVGVDFADWDVDKDQLTVRFDPAKTSVDAVQKAVALSGYDNAGYKAPDEAYRNLHGCCQYDRTGAPAGAKPLGQGDRH